MKEFEIIQKYFLSQSKQPEILLGIGDDAAVLDIPSGFQLVTSMDTLVADVHFFSDQKPEDIGYKSLAVNLSDMAAMAATPKAFLLSITMPEISETWLELFSKGLFELSNQYTVDLIGGDLSKGPLSITITILGFSNIENCVLRSGAKVGDNIYVSGTLGDAGLALELINNSIDATLIQDKLFKPTPRIKLGQSLSDIASSMIDISDGLILDLERVLNSSMVGADIRLDSLPLSQELKKLTDLENARKHALSSGDDYELCFTIPENQTNTLDKILNDLKLPITCIGKIIEGDQLNLISNDGQIITESYMGHEHFK